MALSVGLVCASGPAAADPPAAPPAASGQQSSGTASAPPAAAGTPAAGAGSAAPATTPGTSASATAAASPGQADSTSTQADPTTGLSAADQAMLDAALKQKGEVIEVWAERPDRPFDRDTELRLTGPELARRGVTNLAEALEYIPEINVRAVNRGGAQIDIRGARKGSIKILIDGVPVDDPYRGNFDVSAIPVTDIVEIRVSTSPASPIDGTGGPGGVIEVLTRDAIGPRWLGFRADVNTLPQAQASASARSMLSRHWAARISATGDFGGRDLSVVMPSGDPGTLDEHRRTASGAARFEYRDGTRGVVTDINLHTGGYIVPPSETDTAQVVDVNRDDSARVGISADDEIAGFRMQLRGYAGRTKKKTTFYPDATLDTETQIENATATSLGGGFILNRPMGGGLQLIGSTTIDSEYGDVEAGSMPVSGRATLGSIAAGYKLQHGQWRSDAAAGVALPLDVGASPWPEGKLSVKYTPIRALTARVVGGYKGRLPTLIERFAVNGNEALGPEKALFGEMGVALEKNTYVSLDVSGYLRRTNGLIRYSPDTLTLVNLGTIHMRGVDFRATAMPYAPLRGGADLSLIKATSADLGDSPVDRLPKQRGDVWVGGDLGERAGGVVRLRYTGSMVDQGMTLPSYWLLELSSYVRITDDIMGGLRIDNALDSDYLDRANGVMGVGRSAELTVQGTWD